MAENLIESIKESEVQAQRIVADSEENCQKKIKSIEDNFKNESGRAKKLFETQREEYLEKAQLDIQDYKGESDKKLKAEIGYLEKKVSDNKDKAIEFILEKLKGKE